jgi:hypothetical protein
MTGDGLLAGSDSVVVVVETLEVIHDVSLMKKEVSSETID